MKSLSVLFIILIFAQAFYTQSGDKFIYGVDISAVAEVESNGGLFYNGGLNTDPLQIFKDNGINYCRLRLWLNPTMPYNNLANTLRMAKRIKDKGLKLMLDFHYSDTWADPGNQKKPSAWENIPYDLLKDSLYSYTKSVITALKNQNTLPSIVQIGNEIICGMLWNECRVCEQYNTSVQWSKFTDILKVGVRAVKESTSDKDSVKVMIHIDRGGDNTSSRWFYDKLKLYNVDYDIIGLSYYPWWHGSLINLNNNMNDLAIRYNKEIIVVETAYPWTLNWHDNTNNIVGLSSQLHPGYEASVEGQKKFLADLITQIKNTQSKKGTGLFYWAPDWISTKTSGSPWENLTLFDFGGEVLSSIKVFANSTNIKNDIVELEVGFELEQNFPNPFNPNTKISFTVSKSSDVVLRIYNSIGELVRSLSFADLNIGRHIFEWDGKGEFGNKLSSGLYIYTLSSSTSIKGRKMILVN